jgi:regulatory protein YycI of two-component signal transduction system YycFG
METVNLIFQVIFLILGVFLSALLTRFLSQNGKILRLTEEILKQTQEILKQTQEILKRIEALEKRMDEGFRLIALLILAETPEEKKELARKILREKE